MTYSIIAVDTTTAQVGGAGVSCVNTLPVRVIYGAVPGKGAVHAQAKLGSLGKSTAVTMLADDATPADIIASITDTAFDADAALRQYGIVDLAGRSAGFTGSQNGAFATDRQGTHDTFVYSVQGNILTSSLVTDNAHAAFATSSGCDLADRLMLALEAGATVGEGDSRCTPSGIPGDSAFLEVDLADGTELVRIEAIDTAPASAVAVLRTQYDAWRTEHACPAPPATDTGGCNAGNASGFLVVLAVAAAAFLAACGGTAPPAPTTPDYRPIVGDPPPATAKLYADCLADAIATTRYQRTRDGDTTMLAFTCTAAPAQVFYDGLAAWSAKQGSEFQHAGRTYRSTRRVQRDLFGVDYCATDGATYECTVTLNVGAFVE